MHILNKIETNITHNIYKYVIYNYQLYMYIKQKDVW